MASIWLGLNELSNCKAIKAKTHDVSLHNLSKTM